MTKEFLTNVVAASSSPAHAGFPSVALSENYIFDQVKPPPGQPIIELAPPRRVTNQTGWASFIRETSETLEIDGTGGNSETLEISETDGNRGTSGTSETNGTSGTLETRGKRETSMTIKTIRALKTSKTLETRETSGSIRGITLTREKRRAKINSKRRGFSRRKGTSRTRGTSLTTRRKVTNVRKGTSRTRGTSLTTRRKVTSVRKATSRTSWTVRRKVTNVRKGTSRTGGTSRTTRRKVTNVRKATSRTRWPTKHSKTNGARLLNRLRKIYVVTRPYPRPTPQLYGPPSNHYPTVRPHLPIPHPPITPQVQPRHSWEGVIMEAINEVNEEDGEMKRRLDSGLDKYANDFTDLDPLLFSESPENADAFSRQSRVINWISRILKQRHPSYTLSDVLRRAAARQHGVVCPFRPPRDCSKQRYRTVDGSCNNLGNPLWGATFTPFVRTLPAVYEERDGRDDYPEVTRSPVSHCPTPVSPHGKCANFPIPEQDFFRTFNRDCMEFPRSLEVTDLQCSDGSREQLNQASSFIDGGAVYGATKNKSDNLRQFKGGLLMMSVPQQLPIIPHGNTQATMQGYAFYATDCKDLARRHRDWMTKGFFRETRRIIIAMIQHITFAEYLPAILGPDLIQKYELGHLNDGHYTGYDATHNPSLANSFATVAMRFGHTSVINNLYETDEGTGVDLAANNVQRERDHGLPSYEEWRRYFGLSVPSKFDTSPQGFNSHTPDTVKGLSELYKDARDVDLFTAGVSEVPVHQGAVGPTFGNILAKQFNALKKGDRYWYETSEQPQAFTLAQLREIKKVTIAHLLCKTYNFKRIQKRAFFNPDENTNNLVPCSSIPSLNLNVF
ncbi:LOW QUALITY PROTEIN: chorion peroxidase-like [Liolophura sinensis]|uniref:LOW QUALITY PROTEIN: chorion peroxidase-like n=1 Tax=Liolophura sinensis TaxID=3198878 RepID=UPI003158C7C5